MKGKRKESYNEIIIKNESYYKWNSKLDNTGKIFTSTVPFCLSLVQIQSEKTLQTVFLWKSWNRTIV